jgi:hypothetical protein
MTSKAHLNDAAVKIKRRLVSLLSRNSKCYFAVIPANDVSACNQSNQVLEPAEDVSGKFSESSVAKARSQQYCLFDQLFQTLLQASEAVSLSNHTNKLFS